MNRNFNMDNRPYFFNFITQNGNSSWGFIATADHYRQNAYPIETWVTTNKKYILCRICYNKEQASKLIQSTGDLLSIIRLKGPDIYCVVDEETNETILSVWKPSISKLEILSGAKYTYVDEGSDFNTIKQKILEMLDINLIDSVDTPFVSLKEYRLNFDIPEEKKSDSNDTEKQINITI